MGPLLDGGRLRHAGRDLAVPFDVELDRGGMLHCAQLLRLLPGKRVVVRGRWDGRDVLAKLFFAAAADRHAGRESQGVRALQAAGLHTPELLCEARFSGGFGLLFEFLPNVHSLQQEWQAAADEAGRSGVLERALPLIARMHDRGLKQDDLHLNNFLVCGERIWCIDGDGIDVSHAGSSLSLAARRDNLGLFYAQLPISADALVPSTLPVYLAACAAPGPALGLASMMDALSRQRRAREDLVLAKTLRECTDFQVRSDWNRFVSFERPLASAQLEALLASPDAAMQSAELLKRGNTATVAPVRLGGRDYVLKRYNIKGFWHGLRRALQPSRAWRSWLAGHLLLLQGIPTPRPVLLLEERFGPLRRRAFLLTEAVPGPNALAYFQDDSQPSQERARHAQAVLDIFADLLRARISHGDLKATNLLVAADGPVLIDLDAMRRHRSLRAFRTAFREDLQRFMRNWPEASPAHTLFASGIDRLLEELRQL